MREQSVGSKWRGGRAESVERDNGEKSNSRKMSAGYREKTKIIPWYSEKQR